LEDENGKQVDMTDGDQSYIIGGDPPVDPSQMDNQEIQDWLNSAPDLQDFLAELPNPENYPQEITPPPKRITTSQLKMRRKLRSIKILLQRLETHHKACNFTAFKISLMMITE
jgi:hypothetical protein